MRAPTRFRLAAVSLAVFCLALGPATAQSVATEDADDRREQMEARDALRKGLVRPLDEVLATVRSQIEGDIIEIEFENDNGRFIYELEIIEPSGQLIDLKVDAATKEIIERGSGN